jgi:hypothetical protein
VFSSDFYFLMLMQWPSYFPKDCPPHNALDTSGIVYRIIKEEIPQERDFFSWREENKDQACPSTVTECQACGLSVYTDKNDAEQTIRRIPRFKKSRIAIGTLTSGMGMMANTPSRTSKSHHTWWTSKDIEPWTQFQVT